MELKSKQLIKNINNKKITVIGAGISGLGACYLAKKLNAKVFLSDICRVESSIEKKLITNNIKYELGEHTNECLNADLIIISPGVDINKNNILKKINKLDILTVSEIEFASWFTKNPIIAVTGSNGKSTVVKLLYNIFKNKYPNTLLGGNIGKSFSENILHEINNNKSNVIHILEISSFQLERIVTFSPKVSCILNITSDHLDRYRNNDEYFKTKLKITSNYNNDSCIVFDDSNQKLLYNYKNFKNAIPFSSIKVDKYLSKNKLIGKHNIENLKACIIISKIFDIKYEELKSTISNFTPLEHRMEVFKKINGITFINDSKGTNIFSTKAAINSFNKNIILILGGSKGNINKKDFIELTKANRISYIICYGEIGNKLLLLYKNVIPATYHELFRDAIIASIKKAKDGDKVLLSPAFKSYDQFENFEKRGNDFKKIVNNYYA